MSSTTLPVARRPLALLFSIGRLVMPAIVLFWLAMAFFGHWVAPYDPAGIQDADLFEGISRKFWLGTDYFGRDMLSRILAGARYTVGISLMATSLAVTAGVLLGLAASAIGGFFDTAVSRFLDALISIPSKMFGLVLVAAFGASIPVLVLTLAVIYLPGCYRINRSVAVNVAALDFVAVARARGESTFYIMIREILPNMVGPVLADFGLRFIYVVLLLSSLSFLGLGVQPPEADWGSLVRENMPGLPYGAPAVIMPAIAIASLTIAVNLTIDSAFGRHAREGVR
ncbi:MAG: ABC transporter permease [Beijerinckiaceae bacterium]|nr:ABC transporter permease [Beijerinckiaceae bacterium]